MTPVQLPEVPAIDRYDVSSGSYPMVRKPDGEYVEYDDHAAQLREYATEAVMAERRRVLALAERWRESTGYEDDRETRAIDRAIENCADELTAILTPSETNSER